MTSARERMQQQYDYFQERLQWSTQKYGPESAITLTAYNGRAFYREMLLYCDDAITAYFDLSHALAKKMQELNLQRAENGMNSAAKQDNLQEIKNALYSAYRLQLPALLQVLACLDEWTCEAERVTIERHVQALVKEVLQQQRQRAAVLAQKEAVLPGEQNKQRQSSKSPISSNPEERP
jgi:hypothetical protein